jgi:hypothetical protein
MTLCFSSCAEKIVDATKYMLSLPVCDSCMASHFIIAILSLLNSRRFGSNFYLMGRVQGTTHSLAPFRLSWGAWWPLRFWICVRSICSLVLLYPTWRRALLRLGASIGDVLIFGSHVAVSCMLQHAFMQSHVFWRDQDLCIIWSEFCFFTTFASGLWRRQSQSTMRLLFQVLLNTDVLVLFFGIVL